MSDPFRDQLTEELESYLGHKLFVPEGIDGLDLKAIVETFRTTAEESYEQGFQDGRIESDLEVILEGMNESRSQRLHDDLNDAPREVRQ